MAPDTSREQHSGAAQARSRDSHDIASVIVRRTSTDDGVTRTALDHNVQAAATQRHSRAHTEPTVSTAQPYGHRSPVRRSSTQGSAAPKDVAVAASVVAAPEAACSTPLRGRSSWHGHAQAPARTAGKRSWSFDAESAYAATLQTELQGASLPATAQTCRGCAMAATAMRAFWCRCPHNPTHTTRRAPQPLPQSAFCLWCCTSGAFAASVSRACVKSSINVP